MRAGKVWQRMRQWSGRAIQSRGNPQLAWYEKAHNAELGMLRSAFDTNDIFNEHYDAKLGRQSLPKNDSID
jgi:hypothetical protein